jgi:hypothetical protein
VDDFSLLCETCGYDLGATPANGVCSECGRPVSESVPAHRTGTAWQRSPGLFSWALTCKRVLVEPEREFGRMSMGRVAVGLLALNLVLAGALLVAPWVGVLIGDPARSAGSGAAGYAAMLGSFAVQACTAALAMLGLTAIGTAFLRAGATTRNWRLTGRATWNVACHASVGWLLAAILPLLFMAIWYTIGTLLRVQVNGSLPGRPGGLQVSWQAAIGAGAPVLGFALGVGVFVSRLMAGARACRYAALPPSFSKPVSAA